MALLTLAVEDVLARRAGNVPRSPLPAALAAGNDAQVSNALEMLVKYIPTESVTLYLATLGALAELHKVVRWIDPVTVYWFFGLFLTPVLFFVLLFVVRRSSGEKPLPQLAQWPVWKPFAATIAFLAWALAIPNAPYTGTGGMSPVIAGLLAVVVSTILSLFGRLFE